MQSLSAREYRNSQSTAVLACFVSVANSNAAATIIAGLRKTEQKHQLNGFQSPHRKQPDASRDGDEEADQAVKAHG
jgi:hypothetical protein